MSKKTRLAIAFLAVTWSCFSQTEPAKPPTNEPHYFQLDFAVKELESGKVVTARNYSMTIATDGAGTGVGSLRSGTKMPVKSGSGDQFTFLDLGVNIDCRSVRETQGKLALIVTADVSAPTADASSGPPVIRNFKWSSNAIVPLKKSTVIFSSDDAASKRQVQLELTATPIL